MDTKDFTHEFSLYFSDKERAIDIEDNDQDITTEPIKTVESILDFISIDDKGRLVKDCKWKILKCEKDVREQDLLKLKRDCLIKGYSRRGFVFAKIEFDYDKNKKYYNEDSIAQKKI